MVYTTHYQSPLGALLLAARGDALAGLWLEGQKYYQNNNIGCGRGSGCNHGHLCSDKRPYKRTCG